MAPLLFYPFFSCMAEHPAPCLCLGMAEHPAPCLCLGISSQIWQTQVAFLCVNSIMSSMMTHARFFSQPFSQIHPSPPQKKTAMFYFLFCFAAIISVTLPSQLPYHPSYPLNIHAKFGDASIRTLGGVLGHTYIHTYTYILHIYYMHPT